MYFRAAASVRTMNQEYQKMEVNQIHKTFGLPKQKSVSYRDKM
jgi:hypothetical protein